MRMKLMGVLATACLGTFSGELLAALDYPLALECRGSNAGSRADHTLKLWPQVVPGRDGRPALRTLRAQFLYEKRQRPELSWTAERTWEADMAPQIPCQDGVCRLHVDALGLTNHPYNTGTKSADLEILIPSAAIHSGAMDLGDERLNDVYSKGTGIVLGRDFLELKKGTVLVCNGSFPPLFEEATHRHGADPGSVTGRHIDALLDRLKRPAHDRTFWVDFRGTRWEEREWRRIFINVNDTGYCGHGCHPKRRAQVQLPYAAGALLEWKFTPDQSAAIWREMNQYTTDAERIHEFQIMRVKFSCRQEGGPPECRARAVPGPHDWHSDVL